MQSAVDLSQQDAFEKRDRLRIQPPEFPDDFQRFGIISACRVHRTQIAQTGRENLIVCTLAGQTQGRSIIFPSIRRILQTEIGIGKIQLCTVLRGGIAQQSEMR